MDGNNYFILWSFLLWSIYWLYFTKVSGSQQTDLFRTLIPYLNIQPHNIILHVKENLSNEKFYKETNAEKQDQIRKNMLRLFAILFPLIIN